MVDILDDIESDGSFGMRLYRAAARVDERDLLDEYGVFGDQPESRIWTDISLDQRGFALQVAGPPAHCAVCFLTFAIQEKRVAWDDRWVHPRCLRKAERT